MANQEVLVRITTDASGAITGIDKVKSSLKKMESESQSLTSKIKTHWLGISAAVYGAYKTLDKAWNLAEKAAQFEQSKAAFKSMTASMGADASQLYAQLKQKSAGLIDEKSLVESANRAMSLGIPVEKIGTLMEIARAKARDMGITTTQAFNDIATGVGRASPKILDNLGLMLKVGTANENMAQTLGKTVEELSDKEKQMAILNATIDAGVEALERYDMQTLTTNEKMQKLAATVENLNLMAGQLSIRVGAALVGTFQMIEGASMKASEKIYKLIAAFYEFNAAISFREGSKGYYSAKAAKWAEYAAQDAAAAEKYFKSAQNNFDVVIASTEDLSKIMGNANKKIADDTEDAGNKQVKALETVRQQILDVANADKKSLQERLKAAEKYYQTLRSEIEKNITSERQALEELRSIRAQRVNIDSSTADLVSRIRGEDTSISAKDRYAAGRSALTEQYLGALNLGGQERVKALEDYKQAVASLQAQFAKGIPGVKDIFGKTDDIVSAKSIAEEAISDIERAAQMQQNTLSALAEEQRQSAENAAIWGQTLADEANQVQGEIANISGLVQSLSEQIAAMPKTIDVKGVDQATPVINNIAQQLDKLHDKTVTVTMRYVYAGSASTGEASGEIAVPLEGSYQRGTEYVPKTGIYELHRGEKVVPAAEAGRERASVTVGEINIHIPANAAPQRPEDWRYITRNYIMQELKALAR